MINNMNEDYINIAKEIVLSIIDKNKITVVLFGSRADGSNRNDSDIDIGFISNEKIDNLLIGKIRESLEESIVPYHFDLVILDEARKDFLNIAMKDAIIWNKSKNFS